MSNNKLLNNLPRELQATLSQWETLPYTSELIQFLNEVLNRFDVRLIALFGSVPREESSWGSDLDVLLVATDFSEDVNKRLDMLYKLQVPHIDFQAYTVSEFQQMVKDWHLTVLEAMNDNCILYDPDQLGRKTRGKLLTLIQENKLVRKPTYWHILV